MKLDILQQQIKAFTDVLRSHDGSLHLYKYAMLENFRTTWTFSTDDFSGMYDRALQSAITRRWWKRDHYRPKEMMLLFIHTEEQYVRQAFKELFNEAKSIENRLDSFVFYAEEMLRMYKKTNPKRIENNHYHDSVIISLYLSGMYPERYTLYPGRSLFNAALRAVQARESTDKDDLVRFFKLSHTLYKYLMKDAVIGQVIKDGMRPPDHLLLAHEFLYFLSGQWVETTPA